MARRKAMPNKVTKATRSEGRDVVPTTILLRADQRDALRTEAGKRASAGGRVDVSAVVRDLIDREFRLAPPRSTKTD